MSSRAAFQGIFPGVTVPTHLKERPNCFYPEMRFIWSEISFIFGRLRCHLIAPYTSSYSLKQPRKHPLISSLFMVQRDTFHIFSGMANFFLPIFCDLQTNARIYFILTPRTRKRMQVPTSQPPRSVPYFIRFIFTSWPQLNPSSSDNGVEIPQLQSAFKSSPGLFFHYLLFSLVHQQNNKF